jgi:CHASE1-domain containing sensor protein
MSMLTRNARIGRTRPRLPGLATILTLLAGAALTAILVIVMRAAEEARARSEFLQRAEVRAAAVGNGFSDALDVLQATNALFKSVSPNVPHSTLSPNRC